MLSGRLAAQFINGIQSRDVSACIKHYAAHDQSTASKEDNVVMTARTLREVHLMPFQIAMAHSKPWAFMSAYQMINGLHVSEDPFMLNTVLRDEWGFDGIVISDWWGTYSTSESLNAGMDLEMPGPSMWRGKQLLEAVGCRKVSRQTVDKSVRRLLDMIKRTKAHEEPHVPKGTGEDTEDSRRLIRKAAADSIVLLKNDNKILPLQSNRSVKYGLIGEHHKSPGNCGGGSSEVLPWYLCAPFDAITEVVGPENVRYEPGCDSELPFLTIYLMFAGLTVTKQIAGCR
jgi:beta-glucosidase